MAAAEITASDSTSRSTAAPHGLPLSKYDCLIKMESLRTISTGHLIPRVPDLLRKNEKHAKMFDPAVVAIGPYHRGKPHLLEMEDRKKEAAFAFAKSNKEELFDKVIEVVEACRNSYDSSSLPEMSDEDFALMLFFDGCFILQYIDQFVKNGMKDFTVSAHLHGFILRDMFLLENQLPYLLLEKLMEVEKVEKVEINEFLDQVAETRGQRQKMEEKNTSKSINGPHRHLLARLQELLLGPPGPPGVTSDIPWDISRLWFRSARELVRSGIVLQQGETNFFRDVNFTGGFLVGKLSLPQIVVDNHTRPRLLNMIAFEICSGTTGRGYGVTSFVWFLNLLIDHPEDVMLLRKARVLVNVLGSDEEVAEFFNEAVADLVPDQQPYFPVLNYINTYHENRPRASLYKMLRRNFRNLWVAIAFLAGVVLAVLTVVQTIYTVIQTHYTVHPPTR